MSDETEADAYREGFYADMTLPDTAHAESTYRDATNHALGHIPAESGWLDDMDLIRKAVETLVYGIPTRQQRVELLRGIVSDAKGVLRIMGDSEA